jgi:2',3'-cyclic-nucleotide 2'-phosphodiesterase (5'-nucleotidase family)
MPGAGFSRLAAQAAAGIAVSALLFQSGAVHVTALNVPGVVTLSIVGTTDLHGFAFERDGRGGLAILAGYLKNLRHARAADGGAVLLIDAGDTYQGGIESNLSEGAMVVDAYDAMGYAAAAIGNHEFDFGAVDVDGHRRSAADDPRGALKAIAARAKYPVLAANLIDDATGRVVDWKNVRPSVMVDAAGVRVGIIGVMTIDALRSTLVVNTRGIHVAPLASTIEAEARHLREAGAQLVIVTAHAGGNCARFDNPVDLSSCDDSAEIFRVANALPHALVDVIVAGHTHAAIAHEVNGIPITQSFSSGRAFGRVDLSFDRDSRKIVDATIFAPKDLTVPAEYEGLPVERDRRIVEAMAPELARVRALQATPLGVTADGPIRRVLDGESPVGNLFADAMRAEVPDGDVALTMANVPGGLRADLRGGPLTFGELYDVFPFDNQVVTLRLSGADLYDVVSQEVRRARRGALGISGFRVRAACTAAGLQVDILRDSGARIAPEDSLVVVTTEMLASGAAFAQLGPLGGFNSSYSAPVVREVVDQWVKRHARPLSEREFGDPVEPRWASPNAGTECVTR